MASTQSKLYYSLLRLINKKRFLEKQLTTGNFNFYNCPEPPSSVSRTCRVHRFQVHGRNVFTLSPKHATTGKHILYLHGGAYVQNFVLFHWWFLAELVRKLDCTITAPDYPLAPAHTCEESFAMVAALYEQLLAAMNPDNLLLMGDSAGGGFALALAQKMREKQTGPPHRIILLCPWLDITLTNPCINDIDSVDPFLGIEGLRQAGKLFAGNTNLNHYLVSPIKGSLSGLGKISIFAGSKEILAADTRKIKSLAKANGIELDYYEYADMVHAWMFLNFLPESKQAKQKIMELIRQA